MSAFSMASITHCANGFYVIERLAALPTPDLTHKIHPLFARANFTRLPLPLVYPVLACTLASLFVEKALPFFHSILVAGDQTSGDPSTGKPCHNYPEPRSSLSLVAQQNTRTMLNELASELTITAELEGAPDQLFATCESKLNSKFAHLPGCGSTININRQVLRSIQAARVTDDHAKYLYYNCQLALSLVHEISHAAAHATHTWDCGDGFVGASQSAEIGFSLEAFLFGGLLSLGPSPRNFGIDAFCYYHNETPSTLPGMICIADHPNIDQIQDYHNDGLDCHFRGETLPNAFAYWSVPFSWLQNLFQQDFWDKALTQDNSSLHPPRTIGRVIAADEQPTTVEHVAIYAAVLAKSGRFEVDKNSIITPVKVADRSLSTRMKTGISQARSTLASLLPK